MGIREYILINDKVFDCVLEQLEEIRSDIELGLQELLENKPDETKTKIKAAVEKYLKNMIVVEDLDVDW